jgi:hypothetical protein
MGESRGTYVEEDNACSVSMVKPEGRGELGKCRSR